MKPFTTITILLLVLLTASITTTNAQTVINNELTPQHKHIPGTQVSIVPPAGSVPHPWQKGFATEDERVSVTVVTLEDASAMSELEMTVYTFADSVGPLEHYTINGFEARMAAGISPQYEDRKGVYILMLKYGSNVVLVEAAYPIADTAIGADVKKILLGMVYEPNRAIDPFEALDYTIDTTVLQFKFSRIGNTGTVMFTPNGTNALLLSPNVLMLGQRAIEQDDTVKLGQNLADYAKDYKGSFKRIMLHGISGYWVTTKTKVRSKVVIQQMVVLLGRNAYMLIGCSTGNSYRQNLKEAINTFKLK